MKLKFLVSLAAMGLSFGCQPSGPVAAPTTQQVISTVQTAQTVEDVVVAGLELSGVIKSKNQAQADALQAAINAATAKYQTDLASGDAQISALADAALTGISAYRAASPTTAPAGK